MSIVKQDTTFDFISDHCLMMAGFSSNVRHHVPSKFGAVAEEGWTFVDITDERQTDQRVNLKFSHETPRLASHARHLILPNWARTKDKHQQKIHACPTRSHIWVLVPVDPSTAANPERRSEEF